MYLNFADWLIIGSLLLSITIAAVYTRRYTHSVADFLAANRTAGRYLLCISDGMAGLGAITIVMLFEMYYEAGFSGGVVGYGSTGDYPDYFMFIGLGTLPVSSDSGPYGSSVF